MYNGAKRSQRGTGAAGGGHEIRAVLRVKARAAVLEFFFIECPRIDYCNRYLCCSSRSIFKDDSELSLIDADAKLGGRRRRRACYYRKTKAGIISRVSTGLKIACRPFVGRSVSDARVRHVAWRFTETPYKSAIRSKKGSAISREALRWLKDLLLFCYNEPEVVTADTSGSCC